MATQIARWGNSLAVRIPAPLAEQAGLADGSPVEIRAGDKGLHIRRPAHTLGALLAGITSENLPGGNSPW